jgi:hypothetical protein
VNDQGKAQLRKILPESVGTGNAPSLTSTTKELGVAEQQHGTKSACEWLI